MACQPSAGGASAQLWSCTLFGPIDACSTIKRQRLRYLKKQRLMAEEGKFKVSIDGNSVEVAPGTTILNAARQIGGDIVPPAMCYYSKLEGLGGKCRTCLVKVSKGSGKDPRPMPKLVAS